VEVGQYCGAADRGDEVEFREALAASIPSLIKLLKNRDKNIRQMSLELIGKFANRGEWKLDSIEAQLTGTKSSFMKPSQPQFHRSLNSITARTRALGR